MLSVPAIQCRSDINRSINESCIERQSEGKKPKRNVPQGEGKRKRVEGARREPRHYQRDNKKTVVMNERKKATNQSKRSRTHQENAPQA
jgi:hypothetical protein